MRIHTEASRFLTDLLVALRVHIAGLIIDILVCCAPSAVYRLPMQAATDGVSQDENGTDKQVWEELWQLLERPPPIRRWPTPLYSQEQLDAVLLEVRHFVDVKQQVWSQLPCLTAAVLKFTSATL
jgi:hypothetical protein